MCIGSQLLCSDRALTNPPWVWITSTSGRLSKTRGRSCVFLSAQTTLNNGIRLRRAAEGTRKQRKTKTKNRSSPVRKNPLNLMYSNEISNSYPYTSLTFHCGTNGKINDGWHNFLEKQNRTGLPVGIVALVRTAICTRHNCTSTFVRRMTRQMRQIALSIRFESIFFASLYHFIFTLFLTLSLCFHFCFYLSIPLFSLLLLSLCRFVFSLSLCFFPYLSPFSLFFLLSTLLYTLVMSFAPCVSMFPIIAIVIFTPYPSESSRNSSCL